MFGLGWPELLIIGLVFVLLFGGGKKLDELARSLGKFTGEFKKGQLEAEKEIAEIKKTAETKSETKNG